MTDKSPEAQELDKDLKQTTDYVRSCQSRIVKGEVMDLSGLDNTVIAMCDRIAELPPSEAKELEDKMAVLVKALEGLANTIKEYHDVDEED